MKFSILLPTRNRLEYLKLAVESVMRQDTRDWQLVISDNCSEQDVEGYVASLGDPRILYRRTERVVPVTENWNRALRSRRGGSQRSSLYRRRGFQRVPWLLQSFRDSPIMKYPRSFLRLRKRER